MLHAEDDGIKWRKINYRKSLQITAGVKRCDISKSHELNARSSREVKDRLWLIETLNQQTTNNKFINCLFMSPDGSIKITLTILQK